jgi:AcrR family transcriptional regulator
MCARPFDPNAKIELLRAAEAVFIENGLDEARVEDITERAGRSKGSFYLHFESKEDAFRQIVETMLARLANCIEDPPPDAPGEVTAFVDRMLEKDLEIFEFLWQNRGLMRLLLRGGGSTRFEHLAEEFVERACQKTKTWLRWGIERGLYKKDLDVDIAATVFSGAMDRVARQVVQSATKPDLPRVLRSAHTVLMGGIANPPLAAALRDRAVMNAPVTRKRAAEARRRRS